MNLPFPVILASQSPRRIELLKQLVPEFTVMPSAVEEIVDSGQTPEENAVRLAEMKARSVARAHPGHLVIGADTVVAEGGDIIGKPQNAPDARSILKRLSGREHRVITGVAVLCQGRAFRDAAVSRVVFHRLTEKEIADYVATGEPMDKAGAYAIQGAGAALVESHHGSYSNIVGLPIETLARLLDEARGAAPE
jgi:septum formation protein